MKNLALKLIYSITLLVGAVIAVKVCLDQSKQPKKVLPETKVQVQQVTSNNSPDDASRSYSIDIVFNPEITTKKLELKTYNSQQELYDAFNIKKTFSDIQSDNTNLDKIPEYIAAINMMELKNETVTTLKDINGQWKAVMAHEQPNENLVIRESFSSDKSLFSIGRELHAYAQEFMKRKNLPQSYVEELTAQYHDNFCEVASSSTVPTLMKLVQRLANMYRMATPEIKLSLSNMTSVSSVKNTLTIGIFSFMHFTDDEMEAVLAHEFAHLFLKHSYKRSDLKGGFFMLHGESNGDLLDTVVNTLSRSHERQADTTALRMTKKPEAMISGLLKLGRVSFVGMSSVSGSHPTYHERLSYALAQMGTVKA